LTEIQGAAHGFADGGIDEHKADFPFHIVLPFTIDFLLYHSRFRNNSLFFNRFQASGDCLSLLTRRERGPARFKPYGICALYRGSGTAGRAERTRKLYSRAPSLPPFPRSARDFRYSARSSSDASLMSGFPQSGQASGSPVRSNTKRQVSQT
jgi:hypothetical protein